MLRVSVESFVIWCCVVCEVTCQVRFVCPRPQTALSNISQGPCGPRSFSGDFSADFTTVSPGPLTVHWEDTAPSQGRPSRISLGEWGQKPCVLVDRVPHNDNDTVLPPHLCKPSSHPLGSCQQSGTHITVQIPNVNCTRCYLQLASYATDGRWCSDDDRSPANCTVYYSCANIRIRPTTVRPVGLGPCKNSSSSDKDWPYPATHLYKGNTKGTIMYGQRLEFAETLNRQNKSSIVKFSLDFSRVVTPQVLRVSLHFVLSKSLSAQFFTILQGALYGRYEGAIPYQVRGVLRDALHGSRWFLRLTFQPTKSHPVKHHDFYIIRAGQVYSDLSGSYSAGGWLRGDAFVGPGAPLTSMVRPAGSCAPLTETYGSALYENVDETIRGVVTYYLFDGVLFLKGAFAAPQAEKWALQVQSSYRPGAKIVFEPQMAGNVIEMSLDVIDFLEADAGFPPYKLEARSLLGVEKLWLRPLGMDKRAIAAPIYSTNGYVVGNSMMTFGDTAWTLTALLINPANQYPVAPDVSLRGPITPGFQGAMLHRIPGAIFDNGAELGGWVLHATYSKTDTTFQQYIWLGMITIALKSGAWTFTGKFDRMTEPFCEDFSYSFVCKVTHLVEVEVPDTRGPTPPLGGLVTFGLNERTNKLTYSITMGPLREKEVVVDAFFERGSLPPVASINRTGFRVAFWNERTLVSTGTILLSPELYQGLSLSAIYIGIITQRPEKASNSSMQGVVPDLKKPTGTTLTPRGPNRATPAPAIIPGNHVASCTTLNYARANVFLARVHMCW